MGKICFEVGKGKNVLFYLVLALKKSKNTFPPSQIMTTFCNLKNVNFLSKSRVCKSSLIRFVEGFGGYEGKDVDHKLL